MNNENFFCRESPRHSSSGSNCNGVCMVSSAWRDGQRPSFINYISSFLDANSFRLNTVQIAPDFIFNCGGVSVAFIFVTEWDCNRVATIYSRVQKLKEQFAHMYVIVTLPTKEKNDSFIHSFFDYGMEFGRPTFIPVLDQEMGFEKIVKIAHARGGTSILPYIAESNSSIYLYAGLGVLFAVCKQQDAATMLKMERERAVQTTDVYIKVLTSIPGIDSHDANVLYLGIGSIEAIAKASKDHILANTDLSDDKADRILKFFRDPKYYLGPKIISST